MMQNVLTVLGIIAFVGACVVLGLLVNKIKHLRYTRAWQPIIGVIGGEVHEDPQGGGASSWISGRWKGYTIHARMTPQVRESEYSNYENLFAVGVAEQDGRSSWRTIPRIAVKILSDDDALGDRLRRAGVVARLEKARIRSAWFERHSRYLFVEEDVSPGWIPSPERFVELLDLAVDLARMQQESNA